MKSAAAFCAFLGLATLVQGQSLITLYDEGTSTATPTGIIPYDLAYFVEIGEANGETTFLDNQVKSVYTVRTSQATTTFTTTPTTALGTVIASASGFRLIQSETLSVDNYIPIVGQFACTIDGKGGAGCLLEALGDDGKTVTFAETGVARPNVFTISPSPTGSDATGAPPAQTPGSAIALRTVDIIPLVCALGGVLIGGWLVV